MQMWIQCKYSPEHYIILKNALIMIDDIDTMRRMSETRPVSFTVVSICLMVLR